MIKKIQSETGARVQFKPGRFPSVAAAKISISYIYIFVYSLFQVARVIKIMVTNPNRM